MHLAFLTLLPAVFAAPSALSERQTKPLYWLLVGDSTTAPRSGWGNGFLNNTLTTGTTGHNYGVGGSTTKSFRDRGDWARVIQDIGKYKATYAPYVTIQFGHNDQKSDSNVTLADYKVNLAKFTDEVNAAGGRPVLVTSLTRRTYNRTSGQISDSLGPWRQATIEVANQKTVSYIDLNHASINYCNAIGEAAADKYNETPTDKTHLNERGGVLFSRMVSDLLVERYAAFFNATTKPNATLSALIKDGKPY